MIVDFINFRIDVRHLECPNSFQTEIIVYSWEKKMKEFFVVTFDCEWSRVQRPETCTTKIEFMQRIRFTRKLFFKGFAFHKWKRYPFLQNSPKEKKNNSICLCGENINMGLTHFLIRFYLNVCYANFSRWASFCIRNRLTSFVRVS